MVNHSVCSSTSAQDLLCATQTASHAHSAHVWVVVSGLEQHRDASGHIQPLWISEVGVCDAPAKQQDTIMDCLLTEHTVNMYMWRQMCVASSLNDLMKLSGCLC